MDPRVATTAPRTDAPADAPVLEEDALLEEDLLVEDVSIDGMCGVY
jgi:mycofactocin precursor